MDLPADHFHGNAIPKDRVLDRWGPGSTDETGQTTLERGKNQETDLKMVCFLYNLLSDRQRIPGLFDRERSFGTVYPGWAIGAPEHHGLPPYLYRDLLFYLCMVPGTGMHHSLSLWEDAEQIGRASC